MQVCFFSEMEDIQLLINCGGHWEASIYQGGYFEITFMDRNLTYEDLLSTVHEIVGATHNSFVYEMKSLLNTAEKIDKFKIKNDRDVQFVLGGIDGIPEVYVTIQPCQQSPKQPSQQPFQPLHEPSHHMFVQQDNFLQLMATQFALAHGSNFLFHPNMWNQTCRP